ncbi:hypothetical protein C2E23DRAFT_943117 [Lenzites betulinus]|nr:hypothetical protein C2E23DRAFT_943117 [Lenzites betulinus]
MGRFKGLDEGTGSYIIPDADWVDIARESAAATKDIPSDFVGVIPDLIKAREFWTAETWAFWFMYVAPIVLRGRFDDKKYYNHMCDLVAIMKTTLQFETTRTELEDLRERVISWVERYEEFYYQYDATRLSTCLLVVHGLLHMVDDILRAGPIWATWTFFMERFCGHLKHALRSRTHPWASLDRRVVYLAHAAHLCAKYDLEEELAPLPRPGKQDGPSSRETIFPGYPLSYLRSCCIPRYIPGKDIRLRVARYIVSLIGGQRTNIGNALPAIMPAWGGVRIGEGGDTIRATVASKIRLGASHERNTSYVRYEIMEEDHAGHDRRTVNYGELQTILECSFTPDPRWKYLGGTTLLLALITPVQTHGIDATSEPVVYKDRLASVVVDLRTVQAVVGRIQSRNTWGIVDRSNGLARTLFTSNEAAEVSEEESEHGI